MSDLTEAYLRGVADHGIGDAGAIATELLAARAELAALRERAAETEQSQLFLEVHTLQEKVAQLKRYNDQLGGLLDTANEERKKARSAAGVLCGGHQGVPQARCPVCERDALRDRCRELEPRPLREGDEWLPLASDTVWRSADFGLDSDRVESMRHAQCRIIRIPIPSAAAPPAEVKDGAFVFASEAERQAHLGEVQAAHEFKRKCGGLDEAVRGLPAPPQQPEKARAFAVGDRVRRLDGAGLWKHGTVVDANNGYRVCWDNEPHISPWYDRADIEPDEPLPAEPAEKDTSNMTATEAHMAYMDPKLRLEHLQIDLARTIDASAAPLRAALVAVVAESQELETVRRAALALIGGAR